jgi:hypothetical protein
MPVKLFGTINLVAFLGGQNEWGGGRFTLYMHPSLCLHVLIMSMIQITVGPESNKPFIIFMDGEKAGLAN